MGPHNKAFITIQKGRYQMITNEKAEILSEFLNADPVRAKRLVGLEPDVALEEINALGYNFTLNEIKEYGALVRNAQKNHYQGEELYSDALNEIAGGGSVSIEIPGFINFKISW